MTIEYAKCGLCGGPTYQRKDSADVYHAACLRKIYPKCTLGYPTPVNIPDHGRDIKWQEFSELSKLQVQCKEAAELVAQWPKWKQGLLLTNVTRTTAREIISSGLTTNNL